MNNSLSTSNTHPNILNGDSLLLAIIQGDLDDETVTRLVLATGPDFDRAAALMALAESRPGLMKPVIDVWLADDWRTVFGDRTQRDQWPLFQISSLFDRLLKKGGHHIDPVAQRMQEQLLSTGRLLLSNEKNDWTLLQSEAPGEYAYQSNIGGGIDARGADRGYRAAWVRRVLTFAASGPPLEDLSAFLKSEAACEFFAWWKRGGEAVSRFILNSQWDRCEEVVSRFASDSAIVIDVESLVRRMENLVAAAAIPETARIYFLADIIGFQTTNEARDRAPGCLGAALAGLSDMRRASVIECVGDRWDGLERLQREVLTLLVREEGRASPRKSI